MQPGNTFQLGEYIQGTGPNGLTGTRNVNRNLNITTGLDGTVFGHYNWDLFYTHGENRLAEDLMRRGPVAHDREAVGQDGMLDAVHTLGHAAILTRVPCP